MDFEVIGSITGVETIAAGKTVGMKKKVANKSVSRYVICVENRDYPASLELRKVYRRVRDAAAAKSHYVRIVDESGEDYLYPERFFVPIEVPRAARSAFPQAS